MVRFFDLPWDLVEEILSRVPMMLLTRLQFTCKRWNALCKDPEFIKKNLDKAAKQNLVHTMSHSRVFSLSINLKEIHNNIVVDPTIEFTAKLSRSLNEITRIQSHCDSLFLCSTKDIKKTSKLVLVNLFTGQTRWIQSKTDYHRYDRFALGYANNSKSYDSYKILRFHNHRFHQLEIFELKSNSWRIFPNTPSNNNPDTIGIGVPLKGNTYWLTYEKTDILSFDFTTERFRRLPLPFLYHFISLSVVREEKLTVLYNNSDKHMEIWVSTKIDDTETVFSLSNSFTFDICTQLVDHRLTSWESFLIDEENKVVLSCGQSMETKKNIIHIAAENGCRIFDYDHTDQSKTCLPVLFTYVPSLISLNPPM